MARPYYLHYMQALEKDPDIGFNTNATFIYPGDIGIELDCSKYANPSRDSIQVDSLLFEDPFEEPFDDELNE